MPVKARPRGADLVHVFTPCSRGPASPFALEAISKLPQGNEGAS
jgi:hypothetical protein